MKRTNPINAQPLPLQGQQLPKDWQSQAGAMAKQAEQDYLERLQNAWKQPAGANAGIMQQARLQNPRQDSDFVGHQQQAKTRNDGHNLRFDGQLVLIESRADGWEQWRDQTTGSTVWRRLQWSDVVGRK
jgi:hypothetical protein